MWRCRQSLKGIQEIDEFMELSLSIELSKINELKAQIYLRS